MKRSAQVGEQEQIAGALSIEEATAYLSDALAASYKSMMPEMLEVERAERSEFEASIRKDWGPALDLFEAILILAREAGDTFNDKRRAEASIHNDKVFEVLIRLHAR